MDRDAAEGDATGSSDGGALAELLSPEQCPELRKSWPKANERKLLPKLEREVTVESAAPVGS
jgi:hypothetical protein